VIWTILKRASLHSERSSCIQRNQSLCARHDLFERSVLLESRIIHARIVTTDVTWLRRLASSCEDPEGGKEVYYRCGSKY
jgi:hypothetical protein